MQPITEPGTTRRRLVDRVAIGILIGVVAVSVGGVALLTVYLNRLGDAAAGLQRADALPAYEGRPTPVGIDGTYAVNYLLMTTSDDGTLDAVLIAHLSASRRDLTLVALPSDLVVDAGSSRATLASTFAASPLNTARMVESLTGARMDHQLRLDLDGFASVVDSLGGITLGSGSMDGDQVVAYLADAPNPLGRSVRTAELLRAALARANIGVAIADPDRFDKVMSALTPCLTVDAGLTSDEIRATMVESRVRAERVVTWPLRSVAARTGAQADATSLAELRSALASDAFTAPAAAGATTPIPAGSVSAAVTPGVTASTGNPQIAVAPSPSATR